MRKIGFLGAGNMGFPILKGAVKLLGSEQTGFFEINDNRAAFVQSQTGAFRYQSEEELVRDCEYVLIALKPQVAPSVLQKLSGVITDRNRFITIMAGISIDTLRGWIHSNQPIVRLMPNTPAMVDAGMTSLCFNGCDENSVEVQFVRSLCECFGRVAIINENLMNAAVCANGSSPAYVYMLIEALADSVVKYGIPRDMAYVLAAQTVLGSAKMVLESGEIPAKLKDNVCSPGGTTMAGVSALEREGFRNAVFQATDACYAKSVELGKKD